MLDLFENVYSRTFCQGNSTNTLQPLSGAIPIVNIALSYSPSVQPHFVPLLRSARFGVSESSLLETVSFPMRLCGLL
jgi:hypothetical protein